MGPMTEMTDYTADPVQMTDEHRCFFDLRGWIVLPSVLPEDEVETLKAEVYAGGSCKAGMLQTLLDHPAVVGILNDLLCEDPFVKEECYGFRCEGFFIAVRQPGWSATESRTDLPHVVRPPQQANAMRYQVAGNKIFSGLTREVWELEEVKAGQGGTSFLSGSHKAHFNYGGPDRYAPNIGNSPWEAEMREAMDNYSCPPGSVVIFTESLAHASNDWTNPDNPRCAVFNCYNSVWAQWHKLSLAHEEIEQMPPKRRTLFRGTWAGGGTDGNSSYSLENKAV